MLIKKFHKLLIALSSLLLSSGIVSVAHAELEFSGLIAYYPFSGNVNDSSTYGNHGINHGATFVADMCGNPNSAVNLSRSLEQWVEVPHKRIQNAPVHTGLSIALWINPADLQKNYIVSKTPLTGSQTWNQYYLGLFNLVMEDGGEIAFTQAYLNRSWKREWWSTYASSGHPLVPNVWTHLVITVDLNGHLGHYVNGNLVATAELGPDVFNWPSSKPISIGHLSGGFPDNFSGAMDDIRIYERPLTQDEVTILYNKYVGDNCAPKLTELGAQAYGMQVDQVVCDNLSTGQSVTVNVIPGVPIGSCAQAGLNAAVGDNVQVQLVGPSKINK